MEINYCVYKIINLINNKIYIGKDKYCDPSYMGSGKILKLAYKKYGIKNFRKEIICYCENEDEYNERESFFISEYNSFSPNGYNINPGGKGGDNFKHHPDQEKIKNIFLNLKESNIGRKASDETKDKMSVARTGKKIKSCEKIKCEYCEKEIDKRNYKKWHGEHCLLNPINEEKKRKLDGINVTCPYCNKTIRIQDAKQFHFEYCKENPNKIVKEKSFDSQINGIKKYWLDRKNNNEIKTLSDETKQKISKKLKGRKISNKQKNVNSHKMINFWLDEKNKKYKCEYCNIETTKTNIIRWHGEKCKNKLDI
jgi:group I intron endonuclease